MVRQSLQRITQTKYCILTNNGTSATHLLAVGLKYKYPHIKNIIVPNNVYVAAWNSFLMGPEYNLIPIDCDYKTWNFDLSELDKTILRSSPRDTAILAVHNIGNVINVPLLKRKYPQFVFLEDNCEGFLGEYENNKSGSFSLLSSTSFYGNKTITSGEGGAVFTNDEDLFRYLESVRTQGSTQEKFVFDKLGYNYRMTNIQAAILYGQIEYLDEIIYKKQQIISYYKNNIRNVTWQAVEKDTKHSNWMFGFNFEKDSSELTRTLLNNGVETRKMFYPMSYHKHLSKFAASEVNASKLNKNCVILPSHPNLSEDNLRLICELINNA